MLTGKNPERMGELATTVADWMDGAGAAVPLADIAHTLNHHRTHHPTFGTVCAADREQALAGLRALAAGSPPPGWSGRSGGRPGDGLRLLRSGFAMGGMARLLFADEPAFAAAVAELERDFVDELGFSLRGVLAGGEPVEARFGCSRCWSVCNWR